MEEIWLGQPSSAHNTAAEFININENSSTSKESTAVDTGYI